MRGTGRRLASWTATALIVIGGALATRPAVDRLSGEWRQQELAADRDAAIPRYRNAVSAAYGIVVDDFEDALVSYEVGAWPTDTEGREIAVSTDPPAARRPVDTADVADDADTITASTSPAATSGDEETPPRSAPAFSDAVIRIPKIGLNQAVVEGVSRDHLKDGPGHYPGTALPGEFGNMVISGHRTTFTQPFYDLDLLEAGDEIIVDTPSGSYRYLAEQSHVVPPSDVSLLTATDRAVVTLTTCTPKGSARDRLVIVAVLDGRPAAT